MQGLVLQLTRVGFLLLLWLFIWSVLRILRTDGRLFLSVDIGGEPTPDEPSPFTEPAPPTLAQPFAYSLAAAGEPEATAFIPGPQRGPANARAPPSLA